MTIKFEIEMSEPVFGDLIKKIPNGKFKLSDLFDGQNAVMKELEKNREPLYGHGMMPVAYRATGGYVNLEIV